MSAKKFSLILATCGRMKEVDDFLQSIIRQNCDLSDVEVLVVDQNDEQEVNLVPIIEKNQECVDIRHIKSSKRGLSFSRNIGLKMARGWYVAFPDDDCLYYPDTLHEVECAFHRQPDVEVLLGRIVDRVAKTKIIRDWKDYSFSIDISNFFLNYSAITIFARKNNALFDETLGLGTYFGSYEDADYIVQILKDDKKVQYCPCIEVWHPDVQSGFHSQKVYSYGLGFGALCRKHLSIAFAFLFAQSIGYHFLLFIISMIKLDRQNVNRRRLSVLSRIRGFISYTPKNGT